MKFIESEKLKPGSSTDERLRSLGHSARVLVRVERRGVLAGFAFGYTITCAEEIVWIVEGFSGGLTVTHWAYIKDPVTN